MKRYFALGILASFAVLVSGCWNGRVLLCSERPFWDSLGDNAGVRLAFAKTAILHGYIPHFLVTDPGRPQVDQLTKALAARRYRKAVISPLLSCEARHFAPQFPRTSFVLIGGSEQGASENTILLHFDRSHAYRAAGYAAGLSVRAAQGADEPSARASRIAVLRRSFSPAGDIDSFGDGVAEALDGARPIESEITEPADETRVRTAIERMRREGTEIFFLALGSLDPKGLTALAGGDACAVVSDWEASDMLPGKVFLSIEDDVPGGVAKCLGREGRASRIVQGPVRVARGFARSIPAAALKQLSVGK